ncbi:MAG TPA: DUF4279 domain-containing protein [Mucilaginibacter sp.]|nr:DUF4279 domain-containing protein [Mucilaginibacter sp.]
MDKNKVDLRLIICDFDDITHDDITNLTNIKPTYIRIKGEKRNPKNVNSAVWSGNLWSMDSGLGQLVSFEDQMNKLLDMIEEKIDVFKVLSSKYYLEFACAVFTYKDNGESTPWIHLDRRYNRIANLLNIEFDVDLYAW